jgi:hypothetical protein
VRHATRLDITDSAETQGRIRNITALLEEEVFFTQFSFRQRFWTKDDLPDERRMEVVDISLRGI